MSVWLHRKPHRRNLIWFWEGRVDRVPMHQFFLFLPLSGFRFSLDEIWRGVVSSTQKTPITPKRFPSYKKRRIKTGGTQKGEKKKSRCCLWYYLKFFWWLLFIHQVFCCCLLLFLFFKFKILRTEIKNRLKT